MEKTQLIKIYSFVVLIVNILSLLFNGISMLTEGIFNLISSIIFLIGFGINIGLIVINFLFVNSDDDQGGKWIKNACWLYLLFALIALILLGAAPFIYSFMLPGVAVSLISYILFSGMALLIVYLNIKNLDRTEAWN